MSREYLVRSTYLLYRMNQNLEIPIDCFMKESLIQAISCDSEKILNCLRQAVNCSLDEEKKVVIARIPA